GYDIGDRLVSVKTVAAEGTQQRTFVYDGRGFLISETHPELGVNGGGSTTYSGYDSRGHAGRKITGAAGGAFDLKFTYDDAERLLTVNDADPATASPRTLVSLSYATSNDCTATPCDARNGKLL